MVWEKDLKIQGKINDAHKVSGNSNYCRNQNLPEYYDSLLAKLLMGITPLTFISIIYVSFNFEWE